MSTALGHCPDCHSEITAEDAALPPLCPYCGHRLRPDTPDFWPSVLCCLSKFCTWRGRATRAEFWWFQLLLFIFPVGCNIVMQIFVMFGLIVPHSFEANTDADVVEGFDSLPSLVKEGFFESPGLAIGAAVAFLLPFLLQCLLYLPALAVTVRRLHDTGRSAGAPIAMLVFTFALIVSPLLIILPSVTTSDASDTTLSLIRASGLGLLIISIIALIGLIIHIFICTLLDSHRGPNKYGPSAKYPCA